jgi:hypothetical protein
MTNPDKLFGRLGNRMFKEAFLISYSLDNDIDQYFQDPYFFKDHEKMIRTLYSADIPNQIDKVAIHIRRGDYVNNPFYIDLTKTDYYEKAINEFPDGTEFLIFSDDPVFCESEWELYDTTNMEVQWGGNEVEDMNLMASCKAHIIANSSFSWWGAWLCPNYPNNKVIAPKKWYSDGDNSRTILPNHWRRI